MSELPLNLPPAPGESADVAVIILTRNEELNLPAALESVAGWARQVLVFDSGSTDATVEIARRRGATVVHHPFESYARQRNAALDLLPIEAEWVLFLDADEWVPPALRREISQLLAARPAQNGFEVNRRLLWMGRWIRRGYYPTWILRLFRRGTGRCEDRIVNEHLIVQGDVGRLNNDLMHEDRKGVGAWVEKHNRYATLEARELVRRAPVEDQIQARLLGGQAERKRWLRRHVWERMPPIVRPILFFAYRYLLRGGFLDGRAGFAYHFLQSLWFPLLIDLKYLEAADAPGLPRAAAPGAARTTTAPGLAPATGAPGLASATVASGLAPATGASGPASATGASGLPGLPGATAASGQLRSTSPGGGGNAAARAAAGAGVSSTAE